MEECGPGRACATYVADRRGQHQYGWIIVVYAIALLGLIAMSVVGKSQVSATWPDWTQRAVAAAIGGVAVLCIARMGYVIWRDIDVVRLQKHLIDGLASREMARGT